MTIRPNHETPPVDRIERPSVRGRFFWKLVLANAILLTFVFGACLWAVLAGLDRFHQTELVSFLRSQAAALRAVLEPQWDSAAAQRFQAMVQEVGAADNENIRITLIGPDGRVWADSAADPQTLDSHANRPEIIEARAAGWGSSTRWSDSVRHELQYVALSVGPTEKPRGFVRVAVPLGAVEARSDAVHRLVWTIGLTGLGAALLLTMGLAMLWSGRVSRVIAAARAMSRGDLTTPLDMPGSDEVAWLARALDRMRNRIAAQVATIDGQRRSVEALLGQLSEGVVVARDDGRVIWINDAARKLLDVPGELIGADCTVERCFSQHDVQRLLLAAPEGGTAEARIEMPSSASTLSLLARASDITLPDTAAGSQPGTDERLLRGRLLVLTDISELARAIRLRSDFAANASHELRTPLAALRGAAETLLKMDLQSEGVHAVRFVEMMVRHITRLEDLVSDLLDLARVEAPAAKFDAVDLRFERVISELLVQWRESAEKKDIRLVAEVAPDCTILSANPHLLRLALGNLLDNAIKFSEPAGTVTVRVRQDSGSAVFEVTDQGCGIAPEDQERVFERFYQVTRARSGTGSVADQIRGTGLGLSIVRHAVTALGGEVDLSSVPGQGTTVSITVPTGRPKSVTPT